jgi:hypothetical protein
LEENNGMRTPEFDKIALAWIELLTPYQTQTKKKFIKLNRIYEKIFESLYGKNKVKKDFPDKLLADKTDILRKKTKIERSEKKKFEDFVQFSKKLPGRLSFNPPRPTRTGVYTNFPNVKYPASKSFKTFQEMKSKKLSNIDYGNYFDYTKEFIYAIEDDSIEEMVEILGKINRNPPDNIKSILPMIEKLRKFAIRKNRINFLPYIDSLKVLYKKLENLESTSINKLSSLEDIEDIEDFENDENIEDSDELKEILKEIEQLKRKR